MKLLVFGALGDAAGCLGSMRDSLVLAALAQVDGPAGSPGFVEYSPDGPGSSQGLVAEYLLSVESPSAHGSLDAAVVPLGFYGFG